jgi:ribosomal protein S18 acetylase RimI-like enzyme
VNEGGLDVRPARPDETGLVLVLLNEAAAWLLERGIQQWVPGQWRPERIAASVVRGETYLMWADRAAVATVSLEWRDELMWPDEPEHAGYVHRLAVAMGEHGKDVGRTLLAWAEHEIAERPRQFARLDCVCDNSALRRYYERAGFGHRGDRTVRGQAGPEFCGSRYEKEVGRR